MSPVSQTSRDAYMQAVVDGRATTQRQKVVACLRACGPLTRWELHVITSIRYSSVCGRVNALIDAGIATDKYHTRINPDGGDRAKVVRLVDPKPTQRTFNL